MSELTDMEDKEIIKLYYGHMGTEVFLTILHHYSIE